MKLLRVVTIVILFTAVTLLQAFADGLTNNGHIAGPHTALELTKYQILTLSHSSKITLTPSQKKLMLMATGNSEVNRLEVFPRTIQTCTCELTNVAIRINNHSIEVDDCSFGPEVVYTDADGTGWQKRHDEILAAKEAELRMVNPPKEVQLHILAKQLQQSGQFKKAMPLLEEAIKIKPDYKWARRDLAQDYLRIAGGVFGPASELPNKVNYCERALAMLNGDDPMVARQIRRTLDRLEKRIDANKS